MNDQQNHHANEHAGDGRNGRTPVGDANVERLLSRAYRPEAPDADFAARVSERMLAAATERTESDAGTESPRRGAVPLGYAPRTIPTRRILRWAVAAAVIIAA